MTFKRFCSLSFLLKYTLILSSQVTYTVNTVDDLNDGICNSVHCSLREAIVASNDDNIASLINFNLSLTDSAIVIENDLPVITDDSLTIDGKYNMHGRVKILPVNTKAYKALQINADNIEIYNLLFEDLSHAILAQNTKKLTIGRYNEGNIFLNNQYGVYSRYDSNVDSLFIRHCVFGAEGQGNTYPIILNPTNKSVSIRKNIFSNNTSVLNSPGLIISNSYLCNSNGALRDTPLKRAPKINSFVDNVILGTAQALDSIEIYITSVLTCYDNYNYIYQGETMVGRSVADSSGMWEFVFLNNSNENLVLAIAYDDLNTSAFSYAQCENSTLFSSIQGDSTIHVIYDEDELSIALLSDKYTLGSMYWSPTDGSGNYETISIDKIEGDGHILTDLDHGLEVYESFVIQGVAEGACSYEFRLYDKVTGCIELDTFNFNIINPCTSDVINDSTSVTVSNTAKFGIGTLAGAIDCSNFIQSIDSVIFEFDDEVFLDGPYWLECKNPGIKILGDTHLDIVDGSNNINITSGLILAEDSIEVRNINILYSELNSWFGVSSNSNDNLIVNSHIENKNKGISISNRALRTTCIGTTFGCNIENISIYLNGNDTIRAPIIDSVDTESIYGSATFVGSYIDQYIDVYLARSEECQQQSCQATIRLGQTLTDSLGQWSLGVPGDLQGGDVISAFATDINGNSSEFSSCFFVLPSHCRYSLPLPINLDPCSTIGSIMDMTQLTSSSQPLNSSCESNFEGNDAWYSMTIPASGSVLVRTNIDNTIVPVIQAYQGDCDNLIPLECQQLDSLPYSMVFEDYTPGNTIYLRVWDKDNAITNSGGTALLHLTAHELDSIPDNWIVCDEQNNLLDNPTILSKKDGNTFIVEYEEDASPAEINQASTEFIAEGLILKDECLCNSNPLQLWGATNPIFMEGLKRRSRVKTRVDTANYNYIFENLEFQVNSYAIGQQYETDVSMDTEGNFIMVWVDEQRRHNYGRFYGSSGNPLTPEFRIGAADKFQFNSRVTTLGEGRFLVVWHQTEGNSFSTWGRLFLWDGSEIIRYPIFSISREASNNSSFLSDLKSIAQSGAHIDVAFDGDNTVVVIWNVGSNIFIQRYDDEMNMIEGAKQVGTYVNNSFEPNTAIEMNESGVFVVTWEAQDDDGAGIYAQLFDQDGKTVGDAVLVNNYQIGDQGHPEVSVRFDGSFIIVWETYEQEGHDLDYGIYAQRFTNAGNKVGNEFQVNTYTNDKQRTPSITAFDDGTFYISWSSYGQDGYEEGIYGQVFAADGTPIDGEFQVNRFTDPEQEKPRTSNNGANLFITAWEDGGNDGSYKGIFAQRYEILTIGGQKKFYPIGTTTPSTLLGEGLAFPTTTYAPTDNVSTVRVAIIDTGIDIDHPRLVGSLWNNNQPNDSDNCHLLDEIGYDFVNEDGVPDDLDGHGTQVAGIISRSFNPDVKLEIMNLKFHERGRGTVFEAICAIYYAVDNGADVINLSWGFEASEEPLILAKALKYASDNDVVIVTTAGNTSKNLDKISKYPANLDVDNMIVVTSYQLESITLDKKLSNYACFGANNVDIAAYGFVETTTLGDSLTQSAGTSLAAPFVARTAATIRGLYPMLTAADIKDCILSSAEVDVALTGKVFTNGILNHDGAISCAHDKAMSCLGIDILITLPQNQDSLYQTDSYITSTSNINTNLNIDYKAAQHIDLNNGFCVAPGTVFNATIEDCNPALDPPAFITMTDDIQYFKVSQHSSKRGKVKTQFYVDQPQKIAMSISTTLGQNIDEWTAYISETGWYEKIIDLSTLDNQDYQLVVNLNHQKLSKKVKVKRLPSNGAN